ncbi:1-acyl-sn-glycerol-3-phosphate acyltransferase [Eubacteriales bacterium KG127]
MALEKYFMLPISAIKVVKQLARMERLRRTIDKKRLTSTPAEVRQFIGEKNFECMKKIVKDFDLHITVIDREKIPENLGCVFISNHQGYLDVVAILYALGKKQSGFIAKSEIEKVPYVGNWVKSVGGYFIERGNPRSSLRVFKESRQRIDSGDSILIFPEGTRSQGPDLGEFKPGSFKLATGGDRKAPIVPVVLDGTYRWYEKQGYLKTGSEHPVTVRFLDPIWLDKMDRSTIKTLPQFIESKVRDALSIIQSESDILTNQ